MKRPRTARASIDKPAFVPLILDMSSLLDQMGERTVYFLEVQLIDMVHDYDDEHGWDGQEYVNIVDEGTD